MVIIRPLTENASDAFALAGAQRLWTAYGEFLRQGAAHTICAVDRLEREVPVLPSPYSDNGGEVLLASASEDPGLSDGVFVGCIAYHAFYDAKETPSCELKRLYVAPGQRGRGIGETLVRAALTRAAGRGYRRACLDTAPAEMASAQQLYRRLGFTPIDPPPRPTAGGIAYLERSIP